jgi:clan AA aspartic protease (TIGR02281 family)
MGRVLERLRRPLSIITLVALLVGCGTAAPRQYQAAVDNLASEECSGLQAVEEERERYGIVALSRDLDEEALRQCGLPHSSGGGPPFQPTQQSPPLAGGAQEVKIERHGDTYRVPVRINQTITLPFLLDTGASDLVIPADVALTLIRAGALTSGDFIGKSRYSMANGSEQVSDLVLIREVQVGEHVVRNVTASISPPQGEPLLGQSFLSKFGAVTLDYKRLMLILSR